MNHSSEFGNQMSNFDSSEASNRNPHSIPSGTTTGHDSGIITEERKQRFRGNHNGVNLREWIDNRNRVVDAFECLHIFIQIVEVVNLAHSKGIVVHNIRPSCFIISSLNRVSFIESVACSDSDSDVKGSCSFSAQNPVNVSRTVSDLQSGLENLEEERNQRFRPFPMKQMESNWYTSPEEASGGPSSCASDVYRLGALLFELYCTCSSVEEKNATMSSLRHRVFPPQLLLKWPKEALFCLWLLHPEPDSRPKIDEVLQSEFLNGLKDNLDERVAAIELKERIEEQELLLEFLSMMQKRKQEAANSMRSTVSVLTSDLQEVVKLQSSINIKLESNLNHRSINDDDPANPESRKRTRTITHEDEYQTSENRGNLISKTPRLMRNLRKLESAYFLTRRRAIKQEIKPSKIDCKESIVSINDFSSRDRIVGRQNRWMNSFLDGLCKYLSFSKLKVKADLKQADLLSFSNLVCSLSFDRDGDFFATAGVNKKIKVFEYDSILNGNRDINYPVAEMGSNSKLSSICWNRYIKGQIASSNFEGVVQVWDVTRNQVFTEMREHESRAWSVDFSSADPTLLASGSDDGSIKLWNINQGVSVGTINTKANVCCVQFPPDSGNSLAFGSADHRMYYYDLRNTSRPLCTFIGHDKTVSYVKFIDSGTLISSSTDNTLKLWDLSECSSHVVDSPLQSFTGHVNVKNFVGLSVSEGYIATGSETNEVFIYHKAFPMHAFSYKFNTIDPISGDEVDDNEQFVSSVCWRNQSSVLVAANSMGDIKLLEMI
ncbi:unnamed protein product [Lactuca saligna]|uniref:Protein kinase domain-containing protein n=1 Tax=Lactuca saligna TaxID=75948 RepID=A0AA36EPQ6_LACSI|nr:unnamed protein product [Lactuca saligna]